MKGIVRNRYLPPEEVERRLETLYYCLDRPGARKVQHKLEGINRLWRRPRKTNSHAYVSPTPAGIRIVAKYIGSSSPLVRLLACQALGRMEEHSDLALETLLVGLKDPEFAVRIHAARSLAGTFSARAWRELLNAALTDTTWSVRWHAIRGLARQGYDQAELSRILVECRPRNISYNFDEYCRTVKVIQEPSPELLDTLRSFLKQIAENKESVQDNTIYYEGQIHEYLAGLSRKK